MSNEDATHRTATASDASGIVITDQGVSTAAGTFAFAQIQGVDSQSRNFLLPPLVEASGYLCLSFAPMIAVWSLSNSAVSAWLSLPLLLLGFVLIWLGAESAGYCRRLVLRSAGRSHVVLELKRPWGAAWYLGEARERDYWSLKEKLEEVLQTR